MLHTVLPLAQRFKGTGFTRVRGRIIDADEFILGQIPTLIKIQRVESKIRVARRQIHNFTQCLRRRQQTPQFFQRQHPIGGVDVSFHKSTMKKSTVLPILHCHVLQCFAVLRVDRRDFGFDKGKPSLCIDHVLLPSDGDLNGQINAQTRTQTNGDAILTANDAG